MKQPCMNLNENAVGRLHVYRSSAIGMTAVCHVSGKMADH
jgi:hypothetical protein